MDNIYWFPTYTYADDILHFSTGDIHIREIVRYSDYKRFGSKTRIIYGDQEIKKGSNNPNDQQQPSPPPTPK